MASSDKNDNRVFSVMLDKDDTIISVNKNWLNFARENNTAELVESSVVGKSIWQFIADLETAHLYRSIISKVREKNLSLSLPFRCDSPTCRRFMKMTISPADNTLISLDSTIIKIENREYMPLLDSDISRSKEFIRMCSTCKKIQITESEWYEVEQAVISLDLFASSNLPQITHTICPECYKEYRAAFDAMVNSGKQPESIEY